MHYISVNVGNIVIGHNHPVIVQSMCNCDTDDIETAVRQCKELVAAGAGMVRLTTQGLREVESLKIIKRKLRSDKIDVPLIADVHFSPEVAIAAASVADKVRINPGNFSKDHDIAKKQFKRFLNECKKYGTAVRIGINHGSLGDRITELYGNTPKGMVQAMTEWVVMAAENDFHNIILSLKSSNVPCMTEAYRLLYDWMKGNGVIYPLHIGVTEAGNGDMGRIKSAAGLAALLSESIGDTIRVSLTEPPVNEIPVAKMIVSFFADSVYRNHRKPVSGKSLSEMSFSDKGHSEKFLSGKLVFELDCNSHEEFITKGACLVGPALINKEIDDFDIKCTCKGKPIESSVIEQFKSDIFQAAKRRITQCEYIACPSCGRTLYDIETTFNEVKKRTAHLKGLTIAVMGCIVNGPGEMADADYGYIGEGKNKVSIYRGKTPVLRSVPQEKAIDKLLEIISLDGRG